MRAAVALSLAIGLAACAGPDLLIPTYQPAQGANEVLRGPIEAAPGHELVVGDLVMSAGGAIPRHYHHGEEFLYVIGGSAVVSRPGVPDVTLSPGQGLRIPPGTVHWGTAGPDGVRAVSSWVATEGQPLRVPVPE
jgi:quercetin dioxygenase-like cupin family protein